MKTKETTRAYCFYDHIASKKHIIQGQTKQDDLERNFGKEQARFILENFKIERFYGKIYDER